ncbi:hypothetical protein D6783_03250, partial [Candidatus Woesearchaeota archaeon]
MEQTNSSFTAHQHPIQLCLTNNNRSAPPRQQKEQKKQQGKQKKDLAKKRKEKQNTKRTRKKTGMDTPKFAPIIVPTSMMELRFTAEIMPS